MVAPEGFATRLSAREPLLGTVLTLPSVALAELAAEPFDFVWIDLEHGAISTGDVQGLAVAARAAGSVAFVRPPSGDFQALGALLDAGVAGIAAPRVESAAEARRLVERLRHPPRGTRGYAARRAAAYGAGTQDRELVTMAQIETLAGVRAAAEIAAVDGVDALVVGCADLALALHGRLERSSPAMLEAIASVQRAAAAANIASGIAGPDDAALLLELGGGRSSVYVCSADVRMYARGVSERVAALADLRATRREAAGVGA
jgi:2-keto-3-deoxy-L-rhamnonate aldolase RhmA